jgi:hypothetical protein
MTTRKNIATRDLALAALVGAVPADFGSDFGDDDGSGGIPYLDDIMDVLDEEGFGAEFGDGLTDQVAALAHRQMAIQPFLLAQGIQGHVGPQMTPQVAAALQAAASAGAIAPPPAATAALWAQHARNNSITRQRERLLEPNKGSTTKVERYTFSVSQDVTAGTASTISVSNQPDTTIRPQRVTCNAPTPGFFIIDSIRVANVNVTVGGVVDAFDFNANGVGQSLDMPTLSPSNKLSVSGGYTGLIPSFLSSGNTYKLIVSVKGPASIVA